MEPVVGQLYNCDECNNYDLCGDCKAEGWHWHKMTEIEAATEEEQLDYAMRLSLYRHQMETGDGDKPQWYAECDECDMYPVVGELYICDECENYDLCESCLAKGVHSHHQMTKIEKQNDCESNYQCELCPETAEAWGSKEALQFHMSMAHANRKY